MTRTSPTRALENFDGIASVLALPSPSRLNFTEIYNVVKESPSPFFPHTPTPYYESGQSEEALVLAVEHDVKHVSRELFMAVLCSPSRYLSFALSDRPRFGTSRLR